MIVPVPMNYIGINPVQNETPLEADRLLLKHRAPQTKCSASNDLSAELLRKEGAPLKADRLFLKHRAPRTKCSASGAPLPFSEIPFSCFQSSSPMSPTGWMIENKKKIRIIM